MVMLRHLWWVLVLLGALAPACKSKQPVNGQCLFNSDCDETQNLICAGRYCRQQCNLAAPVETRSRDCPSGTLCQPAAQQNNIGACLPLGDNGYCVYPSECTAPLVCNIDGRCSAQCREARDCIAISLDPNARCDMTDDVGTCSFRDAGMRPTPVEDDSGAARTDTGTGTDGGTDSGADSGADSAAETDADTTMDGDTSIDSSL